MKWLGFQALSHAWLFLFVPPLVLFYFLKLKRPRLALPSLVLWRQVIEDRRVNSPFQRFRRNLLLLLQLLVLALVALAAMQPYWRGEAARAERLPILIDASASMGALDKAGGESRLDAAKARVRERIDGLLPDQELCLVSFGRTARKHCGFTNNKRVLAGALAEIRVEDVESDIEDALRMAEAMARGQPFDEVLILSDGNVPHRVDFDLPFRIDFQRLPAAGTNLGVTALGARRGRGAGWQVLVSLEGTEGANASGEVRFLQGETEIGREHVSLGGAGAERIALEVSGEHASTLGVAYVPDGFDSLASDNEAVLELPRLRPLRVYAATGLDAIRHALAAAGGLEILPRGGEGEPVPEGPFDLVVTDAEADLSLEAPVRLTTGVVPRAISALVSIGEGGTPVVDWDRASPLLQYVELEDLVLLDGPKLSEGARDAGFESEGYEVAVHGEAGPLLLHRRAGGETSFHLLFHVDQSTLPYRVGFPILLANLVEIAMREAGLAEAAANGTGVLPDIAVPADAGGSIRVAGPGGLARTVAPARDGVVSGIAAPYVGRYRLSGDGGFERETGASLLSAFETKLSAVDKIDLKEVTVSATEAGGKTDRALAPILTFAAFWVLLAEWWLFHRRPGSHG